MTKGPRSDLFSEAVKREALPDHPVDALLMIARLAGWEIDPAQIARMRAVCDEKVAAPGIQPVTPTHDAKKCPACNQTVKLYRRKIHITMLRQLEQVYKLHGERPFHVNDASINGNCGDFAKLLHWGLIADSSAVGMAGWWRVTEQGRKFLLDGLAVPKWAMLYNSKCHRLDGPPITARDIRVTPEVFDEKEI